MSDTELAVEPAIAENSLTPAEPVEKKEADSAPQKDTASAIEKMQKRIDKLTWEKNEALRRENDRLRAEISAQSKPAPSETVAPTLEQHGYDEAKFQKAQLEFIEARAAAKAEEVLSKREQEAATRAKHQTFEQKQNDFIKSKPDYAEKVLENESLKITQEMADVIRDSDLGPQVAYYLGENPERAQAIAQLPPLQQARELGRIEAALETQKSVPLPISKAPPPPPKIEASEPAIDDDPDKMPMDKWLKWRNKQVNRKR